MMPGPEQIHFQIQLLLLVLVISDRDLGLPEADVETTRHYQMTLEMLVSLGSSGSMALLA